MFDKLSKWIKSLFKPRLISIEYKQVNADYARDIAKVEGLIIVSGVKAIPSDCIEKIRADFEALRKDFPI